MRRYADENALLWLALACAGLAVCLVIAVSCTSIRPDQYRACVYDERGRMTTGTIMHQEATEDGPRYWFHADGQTETRELRPGERVSRSCGGVGPTPSPVREIEPQQRKLSARMSSNAVPAAPVPHMPPPYVRRLPTIQRIDARWCRVVAEGAESYSRGGLERALSQPFRCDHWNSGWGDRTMEVHYRAGPISDREVDGRRVIDFRGTTEYSVIIAEVWPE